MEVTTLFKMGTSTIDFDPSVPCLVHTSSGFLMSDELRQQMNAGLELLIKKKHELGKIAWLANTKGMEPLLEEDTMWIAREWNARVCEAGVRHIALITPESELAEMSHEVYEENLEITDDGLVVRTFADLASAKAWLKEVLK
ncbi:hypothetical protein JMN32_15415 [Fulvivirga sp. 29W222]|uniref:STAS/SEC14 domain-containing protein n=1 Tax=Fulvivirga marina TaxID=2494733 RepID=A0A937KC26_9BACT|nr:hypothetical protein [Fulvivirga marina]MBL6447706.1 hypothetical protein [Fulvivirga marina]